VIEVSGIARFPVDSWRVDDHFGKQALDTREVLRVGATTRTGSAVIAKE